jgi:hypothetical protein
VRVPGSPGAVSAAASDLGGVVNALHGDETSIDGTANSLTASGHWDSPAAGTFASAVAGLDDEIDRLGGACHAAQGALSSYASQLSQLQSEVDQLNRDAAAAHVSVDDTGNASYHGPPVVQAAGSPTPEQPFAERGRQLKQRADSIADTARQQLDAARHSLSEHYHLAAPWSSPWGTGNLVHSLYTGPASAYAIARQHLDPLQAQRDWLQWKYEMASSPKKARHWLKLLERFDREHGANYGALEDTVDTAGRWSERIPGSRLLGLSVGDLAGDSSILGSRVLRNVPVVGAVLTAGQSTWEIAHGAEPTETITANTTSLVAGAVATDAAIGLAVGAGMVGAAPVVIGVAAGIAVAWGVGEGVHWFFHTDAGHAVAHAVDSGVSTAAHAVGDAGHAVAHGVSSAWHSVFG